MYGNNDRGNNCKNWRKCHILASLIIDFSITALLALDTKHFYKSLSVKKCTSIFNLVGT